MARHWTGTSGWSYANWRRLFYPKGVKQSDWITHYARYLPAVELNATFYRLPAEKMVSGWHDKTPDDFLFAIKAWRAITHYSRLKDCAHHVARLLERTAPLARKRGPVFFQTPPNLKADEALLSDFLDSLPEGPRYAFELRDPSWHEDTTFRLLEEHDAAFVPFELAKLRSPKVATAGFVYVRLHGRTRRYGGKYSEKVLNEWAEWLNGQKSAGRDVYVFFDNTDEKDHAVHNALRMNELLIAGT